ncbi:MAG: M20/M25/M40 family metallo-hydrolase [Bacteroidetes bacterium]|nr:M20/M25/M40 family metallo-hydrolase [Bacteroidota bacterium]
MIHFKKLFALAVVSSISFSVVAQSDSVILSAFFKTALTQNKAYADLHDLCKKVGPRLSGSDNAAKAVVLAQQLLKRAGADTVYLQDVTVPHWVRGQAEEASYIPSSGSKTIAKAAVCTLGGSIATAKGGTTAEIVEVHGLGELPKLPPTAVRGKIVFYNGAFDQSEMETFNAYSKAVQQRWGGAMEAAGYGAVGVVVRSMSQHLDEWPHTGSMGYSDSIVKIPAIAISTAGAEELSSKLKADPHLVFTFKTSCQTLPDVRSANVIGEIKGTEHPEEIIVIGGHLDSWDLAEGAQDDGAGVVQAIEVIRLYKTLGIKPKRTIRVVAFMNEENGLRGGKEYAAQAKISGQKHIAAIESDAGGFTPRGFSLDVSSALRAQIQAQWKPLLDRFEIGDLDNDGAGADVSPLKDICPLLAELHPDSQRYFDFHHSARDVFENVNDRELEMGAAAMASFVLLIDRYGLNP